MLGDPNLGDVLSQVRKDYFKATTEQRIKMLLVQKRVISRMECWISTQLARPDVGNAIALRNIALEMSRVVESTPLDY